MDITVTTFPAADALPETLTVLKSALRIEHSADDTYLTQLLREAADAITLRTGRQLLTCTRRFALPSFWVGSLDVPYPKLASVVSVQYLDADGDTQTLDAAYYTVETSGDYGRLVMRLTPPDVDTYSHKPVWINYTCGFGVVAASFPDSLRTCVRELVRCWYEEQTPRGKFPDHVDAMLDPWKLTKIWDDSHEI